MNSLNAALLVNLLGFSVGVALYGLLAVMVARNRGEETPGNVRTLLFLTAGLGLVWNLGELFVSVQRDFAFVADWPFVTAAAYSALGFLPSVVVHSAQNESRGAFRLTYAAYALSTLAGVLHFYSAFSGSATPSILALGLLTAGALTLAAVLLFLNFRKRIEQRSVWAAALMVFAFSALHLSAEGEGNSWIVELAAHQSSLPLALVILYQNYRFAFADLFLKRAISLLLLSLTAFGLYIFAAAPLIRLHDDHPSDDVQAVGVLLAFWIGTALIYPLLHRLAVWMVDKAILRRVDYQELEAQVASDLERLDTADQVLDHITVLLTRVLTAGRADWSEEEASDERVLPDSAELVVQTAEAPVYLVRVGEFRGGRRLLSDETAMLRSVAVIAARRIDALRVIHERCDREFREQEFSRLAAEAHLTALRSQINPHFLFNALTTIGYLIQTSPDKAFATLLHLTKLLRGVLSTTREFSTLNDELKLIESYLDIERARFEERLRVEIDVPDRLREISLPSLILQPLVENAIKHGISENKNGGTVRITAETRAGDKIRLAVFDTGSSDTHSSSGTPGVGLSNVRGRLASHYGSGATLTLRSVKGGTEAEIILPAVWSAAVDRRMNLKGPERMER
ncbi:MAG: histidine kinase [Blastocatellia bacterium]|nr:histidine kinase [Blastocatellia bacterium]